MFPPHLDSSIFMLRHLPLQKPDPASQHSVSDPVHHDQARNAEGQQNRRRDECPAQGAGRIEPAMASEGDNNIPVHFGRLPTCEPTPNPGYHRYFKQAAACGAHQAPRREYMSELDQ